MTVSQNEFEQRSKGPRRRGIASELMDFLKHNKKWWLLPILVVMLLITVLVVLVGTGAAPFIYTLF